MFESNFSYYSRDFSSIRSTPLYLHVVIILLCYFVCDWLRMRIFSNLMETILILAIYFLKHSTCVAIDAGLEWNECIAMVNNFFI